LASDKELKANSARSHVDDIGRKTLRLGELRNIQEKRLRDEAALKELQETLVQLQGELKVKWPELFTKRWLIPMYRL
jgi:DNA repair protein RAD50